jgi:hypothetical protein
MLRNGYIPDTRRANSGAWPRKELRQTQDWAARGIEGSLRKSPPDPSPQGEPAFQVRVGVKPGRQDLRRRWMSIIRARLRVGAALRRDTDTMPAYDGAVASAADRHNAQRIPTLGVGPSGRAGTGIVAQGSRSAERSPSRWEGGRRSRSLSRKRTPRNKAPCCIDRGQHPQANDPSPAHRVIHLRTFKSRQLLRRPRWWPCSSTDANRRSGSLTAPIRRKRRN